MAMLTMKRRDLTRRNVPPNRPRRKDWKIELLVRNRFEVESPLR
jgi:hypothetical protein